MTPRDVEMLSNSAANFGNSFVQNRQFDLQKRQVENSEQDRAMQLQLSRDRLTNDSAAKVTATISDPEDESQGIGFEGTQDQLQQIVSTVTKAKGKPPVVTAGRSGRQAVARYTVGGSTYIAYTPEQDAKLQAQFKSKGIDPDAISKGGGRTNAFAQNSDRYNQEIEAAQNAETPEEKQIHTENANRYKAWLDKQGTYAPPKQPFSSDTSIDYDDKGNKTGEHKTFRLPNSSGLPSIFGHQVTMRDLQPKVPLSPPQTVPEPAKREVNKVYQLPKGKFTWTGQGWLPAQ